MKFTSIIVLSSIVLVQVFGAPPPAEEPLAVTVDKRQTSREEILRRSASRRNNQLQPRASAPPTECQSMGGSVCLASGNNYKTVCNNQINNGVTMSGSGYDATFKDCLDKCDTTSPCAYVSYSRMTTYCQLYSAAARVSWTPNPDYDMAYFSSRC